MGSSLFELLRTRFSYWEWEEIFGIPSIFYKIDQKIERAKTLACPRCGKQGVLMYKTTVSKKKYKYRKLYVYHERMPIPSLTSVRRQKWCYLNRNQLRAPSVQNALKATKHAKRVEKCFYDCIATYLELRESQ